MAGFWFVARGAVPIGAVVGGLVATLTGVGYTHLAVAAVGPYNWRGLKGATSIREEPAPHRRIMSLPDGLDAAALVRKLQPGRLVSCGRRSQRRPGRGTWSYLSTTHPTSARRGGILPAK